MSKPNFCNKKIGTCDVHKFYCVNELVGKNNHRYPLKDNSMVCDNCDYNAKFKTEG
jgi:hypothetical protein